MDKELQRLIDKINILDSHSLILFAIRDSKTMSVEMEKISKIILPNWDDLLDKETEKLYVFVQICDKETLAEIIRAVNPGMMRMELRKIYKSE